MHMPSKHRKHSRVRHLTRLPCSLCSNCLASAGKAAVSSWSHENTALPSPVVACTSDDRASTCCYIVRKMFLQHAVFYFHTHGAKAN